MPAAQLEFMIGHQKHHEQHGGPAHRDPHNKDSSEYQGSTDKANTEEIEHSHV